MEHLNYLQLLGKYLKRHYKLIIAAGISVCVTLGVFWIYSLQTEPVIYSMSLVFIIFIPFAVRSFYQFAKKHKVMEQMEKHPIISLNQLGTPSTLIEEDYHILLKKLMEERADIISKADNKFTNMMEYYTLWVHQVKTPIAAMRLLLQSAKENSEENGAYLELEAELFKIEQYVEMVLQYLRLEEMSQDLELKEYSIKEIVNQALRKYSKLFIQSGISLRLDVQEQGVITDEKWLLFVIEQLLSNALKYTREGTISIYTTQNERYRKILVIEDTGIGIRTEDIPRIFEKGFTGFNGRMDKRSTGIGLYLCKQVLTKLSHQIYVDSQIGKGTTISIVLDTYQLNPE